MGSNRVFPGPARLRQQRSKIALLGVVLLTGCTAAGFSVKHEGSTPLQTNLNSRPAEITAVATKASTVIDTYCPRVVQPYQLVDNAASLANLGAQLAAQNAFGQLQMKLGKGSPGSKADVMATLKLAAKQLNWMPMEGERLYSEWQRTNLENTILLRTKRTAKEYAYADRILADILASVAEPHDYQFKIFIAKNDSSNAVSYPGGYVFVDRGLLKPKLKAKAYFAIAHEIAHVLQRHATKELESSVIDGISATSDLIKLLQEPKVNMGAVLNLAAGTKGLFSRHFADQELQADACATRMIAKIFPQPEIAKKMLHDFIASLGKAEAEPELKPATNDLERYAQSVHMMVSVPYRRHPNTALRLQNIDLMYAQLSARIGPSEASMQPDRGSGAAARKLRVIDSDSNSGLRWH